MHSPAGVWNNVKTAILTIWRHIRNQLCQWMGIYLKNNNCTKFHIGPIWNDGASGLFKNKNNNKNKMSSDMESVSGLRTENDNILQNLASLWRWDRRLVTWEVRWECRGREDRDWRRRAPLHRKDRCPDYRSHRPVRWPWRLARPSVVLTARCLSTSPATAASMMQPYLN